MIECSSKPIVNKMNEWLSEWIIQVMIQSLNQWVELINGKREVLDSKRRKTKQLMNSQIQNVRALCIAAFNLMEKNKLSDMCVCMCVSVPGHSCYCWSNHLLSQPLQIRLQHRVQIRICHCWTGRWQGRGLCMCLPGSSYSTCYNLRRQGHDP